MKFRDFHPNVQIRIALGFFGSLLFNMVIPYMAIYFAGELGDAVAGLALTGGVMIGFATGFLSGYWSDRIGRKPFLAGAEFVWLGSYLLMALATSAWIDSAWLALIASFGIHVGWGLFGPVSDGMLLDVTTPEQRKYMYSIFYWSNNLAIALGGMVGAYLFKTHLAEMLIALTAMSVVSTVVTVWRIDETHRPVRNAAEGAESSSGTGFRDVIRSYGRVLRDRTFMLFMAANLFVLSSEFHLGNYIGVRLADEMGVRTLLAWGGNVLRLDGVQMLGLLRTENTLFVVLFSLFAVAAMRRFKEKHTLFGGMILYVAGYAFLMVGNDPWPLILAMALATWGEVVNVPIRMTYFGSIAPDDARGAYMAVGSLTGTGSMMIGTLAVSLGAVFPSWSMGLLALFVGASGIAMFASITPKLDERVRKASAAAESEAANGSAPDSKQSNSAVATL